MKLTIELDQQNAEPNVVSDASAADTAGDAGGFAGVPEGVDLAGTEEVVTADAGGPASAGEFAGAPEEAGAPKRSGAEEPGAEAGPTSGPTPISIDELASDLLRKAR